MAINNKNMMDFGTAYLDNKTAEVHKQVNSGDNFIMVGGMKAGRTFEFGNYIIFNDDNLFVKILNIKQKVGILLDVEIRHILTVPASGVIKLTFYGGMDIVFPDTPKDPQEDSRLRHIMIHCKNNKKFISKGTSVNFLKPKRLPFLLKNRPPDLNFTRAIS